MCLTQAFVCGHDLHIDLWYPQRIPVEKEKRRECSNINAFVIGLMDVRAADDIRISYDFDRDGWAVQQSPGSTEEDSDGDQVTTWVEVAFIRAWALEDREADDE